MPTFFISIPVESHVVKKNNRPILGRGEKKWIGKSPKLKSAEEYLTYYLLSAKHQRRLDPLKGDIHAVFRFYMTNYFTKDGKRSRAIADLSNLIELPQDCLQAAGIIENDNDIVCLDGSGRFPGKENVLEIELRVLDDGIYARRP